MPFWRIDSFGEDIRDKVKIRHRSMFLAVEQSRKLWLSGQRSQRRRYYLSGWEERAHPLHWRQRRKTGGLSYPHKGEEATRPRYWRRRTEAWSGAQYPWSMSGSMEDRRELWCDGKRLPQVQIRRLSLIRVWVTVGTGPQCCNGKTFGLPIKGYILYCKRVG